MNVSKNVSKKASNSKKLWEKLVKRPKTKSIIKRSWSDNKKFNECLQKFRKEVKRSTS